MTVSYRLEIDASHVIGLDGSLTADEIIQHYSVRIIACDGNDYDGVPAGNAEFYIVKVGAAANHEVSLSDAIDSISQDVYEYGAAVLDPETDDLRDDLVDRFECMGGDIMFLHLMKILPGHRGRNVGLVAASRLIDAYANGLVVCRPQPLQHVGAPETNVEDESMEYQRFSTDRRNSKRKLQRYWGRLGFQAINDDGIFALGTARAMPTVEVLPPPATRGTARAAATGRKTTKKR